MTGTDLYVKKPHCTAAAQCGFFTYKSVPVIFEPPCIFNSKASTDGKAQEANYLMKYTSSQITGITPTVEVRLRVIITMSLCPNV